MMKTHHFVIDGERVNIVIEEPADRDLCAEVWATSENDLFEKSQTALAMEGALDAWLPAQLPPGCRHYRVTWKRRPDWQFTKDCYPNRTLTVNGARVAYSWEIDRRHASEAIRIRVAVEEKPSRAWMSDLCEAIEQVGDPPLRGVREYYPVVVTDRHGEETWVIRDLNYRVEVGGQSYAFAYGLRSRGEEGAFVVQTPLARRDPTLEMAIIAAMLAVPGVQAFPSADYYEAEFFTRDGVAWTRPA